MKSQSVQQNNCKLTLNNDFTPVQDYANSCYQFKIIQLQQQNQILGDQSQSLIQFPSQTLVNQGIALENNIRIGVNSETCDFQNDTLKNCVNNSIAINQNESQFFECSSKYNNNEYNDTCCQISKADQLIPQEGKIQFIPSTQCERQSYFSANQVSSMFAKYDKNKSINLQSAIDSKEANKLELKQRGYKKRNNLLTRDNYAQKQVWRKKWLQILALVSKMKRAAYQSSLFYRPQCLREIQIRLINDISSNQINQIELSQLDKYNLGRLFNYANFKGMISLLYLLAQVIYFAHLFTCLWNYVGLLQLQSNTGWIVTYNYQSESVTSRYIQTFYYAVVTMTTIGYGDFTAQTQLEKLLMIFIAFFSCGIFGYTINSIGNILYDIKQKRDLYLQELAKINKYFKQNNVELGLQCRAKKYIQYLYSDQYCDQSCSIKSLSSLSVYLQKEIQQDVYIKMLKKVPIFREIASEQIFNELALLMKERIICHDQIVTSQEDDDENENFIYFVNDGTIVEFCQHDTNTQIKEVQKFRYGQYFGLVQFICGNRNQIPKYKSYGISSVLQLSRSSFFNVLRKYDQEYQKFCHVKDEVKFESKFQKINSYCYSCKQKNHIFYECPYLFYEGKKSIILRQYFKECNLKIKHFQRKKQEKSLNALTNQVYVEQCADKHFLQNMPCFSMWYESQESESQQDSMSDQDFSNQSKEDEISQLELCRNISSDQKYTEQKKRGSIIEDSSQVQIDGRKFSLQIQNQLDQGDANLLNVQKVYSAVIQSRMNISDDEESVNLEDNYNSQICKNKRNQSQKNIKTKDSSLSIQNLIENEQFNSQSQTKLQTNHKLEMQQSSQINKKSVKFQDILKNIEFLLSSHQPLNCLNQNCQSCIQTENNLQNILKDVINNQKYRANQRPSIFLEPSKMKTLLQSTKQRTAFIQNQTEQKTTNFSNKNMSI
ncbi:hypothetical protein ABPG73_005467, partial [Tetrahymena malaccensis]